jgi:HK97 family phage major capsid protein
MKIMLVAGAIVAALLFGVTASLAGAPDFLHHLAGAVPGGDAMLALGIVPAVAQHALVDQAKSPLVYARPRGLVLSPRMDASDASKILNELRTTFEEFKAANNKEIADLKKGMGDVVQTEKVDRINNQITELQTALDGINAAIAALKVGGAGDGKENDPDKKAYATAWDKFFRRGAENGLRELEVKAKASTDSNPDGGYTVPDQVETTIDRVLSTVSVMRQISRVMSISAPVYKKLVGQGGAGAGWVGEREARPETNTPTLSELQFPAMELYAMPAATQQLLDDSAVDIAAWLGDEVNLTFAEQEGAAFISGNGVNKPRGLLSYTTVADASYAWGKLGYIATGAASDFNTSNPGDALIDLVYALKQGYRQNARWLMNRKVQGKVRKFKDGDDNYLWQPGIQAGQPATLLGYAISDDDNMSDVGSNAFPVAFGDFQRGYLIVDRQGIRVLRDPFTSKPYVLFYTTKRVGGGVQNFEAIKLLKCATS